MNSAFTILKYADHTPANRWEHLQAYLTYTIGLLCVAQFFHWLRMSKSDEIRTLRHHETMRELAEMRAAQEGEHLAPAQLSISNAFESETNCIKTSVEREDVESEVIGSNLKSQGANTISARRNDPYGDGDMRAAFEEEKERIKSECSSRIGMLEHTILQFEIKVQDLETQLSDANQIHTRVAIQTGSGYDGQVLELIEEHKEEIKEREMAASDAGREHALRMEELRAKTDCLRAKEDEIRMLGEVLEAEKLSRIQMEDSSREDISLKQNHLDIEQRLQNTEQQLAAGSNRISKLESSLSRKESYLQGTSIQLKEANHCIAEHKAHQSNWIQRLRSLESELSYQERESLQRQAEIENLHNKLDHAKEHACQQAETIGRLEEAFQEADNFRAKLFPQTQAQLLEQKTVSNRRDADLKAKTKEADQLLSQVAQLEASNTALNSRLAAEEFEVASLRRKMDLQEEVIRGKDAELAVLKEELCAIKGQGDLQAKQNDLESTGQVSARPKKEKLHPEQKTINLAVGPTTQTTTSSQPTPTTDPIAGPVEIPQPFSQPSISPPPTTPQPTIPIPPNRPPLLEWDPPTKPQGLLHATDFQICRHCRVPFPTSEKPARALFYNHIKQCPQHKRTRENEGCGKVMSAQHFYNAHLEACKARTLARGGKVWDPRRVREGKEGGKGRGKGGDGKMRGYPSSSIRSTTTSRSTPPPPPPPPPPLLSDANASKSSITAAQIPSSNFRVHPTPPVPVPVPSAPRTKKSGMGASQWVS